MRTDEIEEEDEQGNEVICGSEGRKALFGFVPGLELFVEGLDEVVGNIVVEALDLNMLDAKDGFDWDRVGRVTVGDEGGRLAKRGGMRKESSGLGGITVRREMKADHEAGLAVNDEPEVVLDPGDFYNGFIGVPLIGIEVEQRQELDTHVIEERGELGTPVADSNMRDFDRKDGSQDETDVAERAFAQIEHGEGGCDDVDGVAHTLEVVFAKQRRHRR